MGDPITVDSPSLSSVMLELVSCMSSLNMPSPREASPEDIVHAYDHLKEAIRQLAKISNEEKRDPSLMEIDVDALVRSVGFDPLLLSNKDVMKRLARSISVRVVPLFMGKLNTPETKSRAESIVYRIIHQMAFDGEFFRV